MRSETHMCGYEIWHPALRAQWIAKEAAQRTARCCKRHTRRNGASSPSLFALQKARMRALECTRSAPAHVFVDRRPRLRREASLTDMHSHTCEASPHWASTSTRSSTSTASLSSSLIELWLCRAHCIRPSPPSQSAPRASPPRPPSQKPRPPLSSSPPNASARYASRRVLPAQLTPTLSLPAACASCGRADSSMHVWPFMSWSHVLFRSPRSAELRAPSPPSPTSC
eukprot:1269612-Pleurochrysis_carterae.AAC.2